MSVADRVVDGSYIAGWRLVRRLPERTAYATFERLADATWARRGKGVRRLESNLRRVVGPQLTQDDLRLLSRAGMRSYLRYWCEAFRLPGWSRARIVDTVTVEGEELLVEALAAGGGAVFAIPHMGNWDHAGAWASLVHSRVVTVAERLKPEGVYEQFLDYRRSLGMEIIPLTGGPSPYRTLLTRLREGALVCLLADRDLTENGLPVDFFGAQARFPAGPAALAVQSGAPLLTAGLWYEPGRLHIRIRPVEVPDEERQSAIRTTTQRVADGFAREIAEHPQDWHMLQRLWTADLDPARVPA